MFQFENNYCHLDQTQNVPRGSDTYSNVKLAQLLSAVLIITKLIVQLLCKTFNQINSQFIGRVSQII